MPLGSLNNLPFRVGGGPTAAESAYSVLRQAVGTGGSAANDRGIEGLWRRSEAKGLAAAASSMRRAMLQAFPYLATDLLPYYERILGLVPQGSEEERRQAVVALWTANADNPTQVLLAQLQRIDARLSLIEEPHSRAATVQYGRAFAPHDPALEAPAFGLTRGHVQFPNYSTDMILRVLFSVGHTGPLTGAELLIVERVKSELRKALPSTTDFTIAVDVGLGGTPGLWHVGSTPIGFGGVG